MRSRIGGLGLATLLLLAPQSAEAYSIKTGFTDGCHELITVSAARIAFFDTEPLGVPIPDDRKWDDIADWIDRTWPEFVEPDETPQDRILRSSLLIGVRSNDTHGSSALNLTRLREIHAAAAGQDVHCLRNVEHDGVAGDAPALRNCRAFIAEQLQQARLLLLSPPKEQVIDVKFSSDFYGEHDIPVWGPAYYVGRALHTLQDSFTHTLRTDDLRGVVHVMNYVEAIQDGYHEEINGLRHSESSDTCLFPLREADLDRLGPEDGHPAERLMSAAIDASTELLLAASAELWGVANEEIDVVFENWFQLYDPKQDDEKPYETCIQANDYCDNLWLEHARKEKTGPYIESALGCRQSGAQPEMWALLLGLGLCLRRARRGWLIVAALLGLSGCGDDETACNITVRTLYPSDGPGDRGFADLVLKGLTTAQAFCRFDNVEVLPCRNRDVLCARSGCDLTAARVAFEAALEAPPKRRELVVAVGFQYRAPIEDALDALGDGESDRKVLLLDDRVVDERPALRSETYQVLEPSFLAGVAAAHHSESGIAVIAAADFIPGVRSFVDGFRMGAEFAGKPIPDAHVFNLASLSAELAERGLAEVPGCDEAAQARPFRATTCAEQLARELFLREENPIDVIFPVAGGSSLGVLQAARALNKKTFGIDADQSVRGASVVIGSVRKRLELSVTAAIKQMARGQFDAGHSRLGPAPDDKGRVGSDFFVNPRFETPELTAALEAAADAARAAVRQAPPPGDPARGPEEDACAP